MIADSPAPGHFTRSTATKVLGLISSAAMWIGPASAAGPADFERDIKPILQKHCVQCHGPEKQKGKLRLDTKEAFLKGGDNGPVVTPGNPEKSDLFHRITLAESHDDVMPPAGKADHLTPAQIALVKQWIADGARWPDGVVVPPGAGGIATGNMAGPPPTPEELQAVAELAKLGIHARPIAAGANWRRVNFRVAGDKPPATAISLVRKIASVTDLDLGGTQITDADLAAIAEMRNLTALHLESTPITDAGLAALKSLDRLTYLNLFGTAVTDAGLATLASHRNLKALFVAETRVTAKGISELKMKLPDLEIDDGSEIKRLAKPEPPPPPKPPDAPKPPPEKKPEPVEKSAPPAKPADPAKQPAVGIKTDG